MQLASAPKIFGRGVHRVMTPEQTLQRIRPVAQRAGVTRLSDITHLDRIGIPAYSATVPRSKDVLSVYNGKGAAKIDAACGALMEAIERQSALELHGRVVCGTHAEVSRSKPALDPASLVQALHSRYSNRLAVQWVEGWDLVSNSPILVPARVAGCSAGDAYGPPCLQLDSSNGLASGNILEEALCHALCEVIERDAWTIAEILAQWLPLWKHQQADGAATPHQILDDIERYPEVDLSEADGSIRWMLRRFARAGLQPRVKDITSDIGVPTILATVIDDSAPDRAMAHGGAGTHPDARIAAIRALSEAAQSRVVDIQGVREDISQPDDVAPPHMRHTKRLKTVDRGTWYHCPTQSRRRLADIPTAVHGDILDDIRFMIDRLVARGLKQVIVVDLTDPALLVPVVRVIVPGLESWAVDRNRIGDRVTAHWCANE